MSEGARLADQARQMSDVFQTGVVTAEQNPASAGGPVAAQFPRKFGGRDPYDDVMNMRRQLADANGNTPFGQLEYTDDVARWAMRKQAVAEEADFDAWFNRNYNKNNLASRQFAQEINPQFYSEREKEIMARAKEAAALKIIQLRGPKTKEELYKVWLIESGRVDLPKDWDRIGPSYAYTDQEANKNFKKGLLSLPKFLNRSQRNANAGRPSNPFKRESAVPNRFPLQGAGQGSSNAPLSNGPNTYSRAFLAQAMNV